MSNQRDNQGDGAFILGMIAIFAASGIALCWLIAKFFDGEDDEPKVFVASISLFTLIFPFIGTYDLMTDLNFDNTQSFISAALITISAGSAWVVTVFGIIFGWKEFRDIAITAATYLSILTFVLLVFGERASCGIIQYIGSQDACSGFDEFNGVQASLLVAFLAGLIVLPVYTYFLTRKFLPERVFHSKGNSTASAVLPNRQTEGVRRAPTPRTVNASPPAPDFSHHPAQDFDVPPQRRSS